MRKGPTHASRPRVEYVLRLQALTKPGIDGNREELVPRTQQGRHGVQQCAQKGIGHYDDDQKV